MTNLLDQAINTDDSDHAAKIIQSALGIESDEVANYCFPKAWPHDREQRAPDHRRMVTRRGALLGVTEPRRPWTADEEILPYRQ
jgi:hypothetical protein